MSEPTIIKDKICVADDGGIANMVHDWAETKHQLVRKYAGISSGPRKKFGTAGCAYLDPYCATGRAYIYETKAFTPGSPLHAWSESKAKKAPFTHVLIGDADRDSLAACSNRLANDRAPVRTFLGNAEDTVDQMIKAIDPNGLHFALLDPYGLSALPFSIIEKLCAVKRMDILIHVSTFDLQRNFFNNQGGRTQEILEAFAPGWRDNVNLDQAQSKCRDDYFKYWLGLIEQAGKKANEHVHHMKTARNNTLYYLVMVSAHKLGHTFWEIVSEDPKQPGLF